MPEHNFPPSSDYDFIFLGMGCATLSLVMRMIRSEKFADKKILLIDKEPKTKNDRTWCFWEKENGFFDSIVYKKWPSISILNDQFSSVLDIAPYKYKMIRGIDLYDHCLNEISQQQNIDIVYSNLNGWGFDKDRYCFNLDGKIFYNIDRTQIFNSIYKPADQKGTIRLLQHFKGWIIDTATASFDPQTATIMDLRVDQQKGTTFGYVLPFSETSALVEYTFFTKEILQQEDYDVLLKNYLKNFLKIEDYSIRGSEFGIIPMSNEDLPFYKNGAYQIGTAGGQTKPSSGYTFQFIQKQSDAIVKKLGLGESIDKMPKTPSRFRFYDHVLLDILYYNKYPGDKIFTRLFKKNKPQQVLRFLDNESSLYEEIKLISTLPTWPFLSSAIKQL